jgi:prophage DNA circulation protein
MANAYFKAEFGGIPLLIAELDTVEGRDVVVQSPSRGDVHSLKDRGRKHRVTTCEVLFIDQPAQAPYLLRFKAFRELANEDAPSVLTHPLLGAYTARVGDFTHKVSADSLGIEVHCTFYAEEEPEPVLTAGAGTSAAAGLEAVTIAAATADEALAAVGETSATPSSCAAAVTGWSEAEDLDSQRVFLEAASLVEDLNTEIEALSVSLDDWPA